jgi:hypothetical protein
MSYHCINNEFKPWEKGYFIYQVNGYIQTYPKSEPNYKEIYNQIHYSRVEDKIIKIQRLYRLYKWNKHKKSLWEIAEYYTAKKYSPSNILNYIELDDSFQQVDVNELD